MPRLRLRAVVVGGGIVGLATARSLQRRQPDWRVTVLEKESAVARHQSGRNSGVVHSGIYYRPGSRKAALCLAGRKALEEFCAEHGIPYRRRGKLILATTEEEAARLPALQERGRQNGVDSVRLGPEEIRAREPHATGNAALHVPATGVVDFAEVCRVLAGQIRSAGGEILTEWRVRSLRAGTDHVRVHGHGQEIEADLVIACAGLHADRLARSSGLRPRVRLVPFRGEYFRLSESAAGLCRALLYPVPKPELPFLGVHLTRRVDEVVEAGPNAVLAGAREGYRRGDFRWSDAWSTATSFGFWRMAWRHRRSGLAELRRSRSRAAFLASLQRLLPELRPEDLSPSPAGVRAQAVAPDGTLVDDFVLAQQPRVVHVLNAPSPAATASLALGEHLAGLAEA